MPSEMRGPFLRFTLQMALCVGLLFHLASCSSPSLLHPTSLNPWGLSSKSPLHLQGQNSTGILFQEVAALRAQQVENIQYQLSFQFLANADQYVGQATVHFDLKASNRKQQGPLWIDLEEGQIVSIHINGTLREHPMGPESFDGHHILIPFEELQKTGNQIKISWTHPYSLNGSGLYRFIDPVDHEIYLYSHFEPYSAHRMFPCFDQPDLKATYILTVDAPRHWNVISNTLPAQVSSSTFGQHWQFPPSPRLSPYLFALHAGPYATWSSHAGKIPLRLFARKSLAHDVDFKEWFDITQKGLDFYGVQFGIPYPFKKYDQIIVPDFVPGAMENAGAVTFSEMFIHRTPVSQDVHLSRAETILHEMAHMWFGDLVTLRWWNGLWLNESFASFMATWALQAATPFQGGWQAFFKHMKQWAYTEDQWETTHPIDAPVSNTAVAESHFDGITYGKGAAALKQLKFYLGEEDFREGLQRYFEKYSWRNTTLADFIQMLSEASNQNLKLWQEQWLQSSGVNTLEVQWSCSAGDAETEPGKQAHLESSKITVFDLLQSGPAPLRMHRTQIALYTLPAHSSIPPLHWKSSVSFPVSYSGPKTSIPEMIGKPCPSWVFPNEDDLDYVKIKLDSHSLQMVTHSLEKLADPLTRQILWHTLWENVLDGELPIATYIGLAFRQLKHEKDTQILSFVLKSLHQRGLYRSSAAGFLTPAKREKLSLDLNHFIQAQLQSAAGGSDLQLVWYDAFTETLAGQNSIQFGQELLKGRKSLQKFAMHTDRRWQLIVALASAGASDALALIDAELKKDPTDFGNRAALAAQAAIPSSLQKQLWFEKILHSAPLYRNNTTGTSLSIGQLRNVMSTYQQVNSPELTAESVERYFEELPQIALSTLTDQSIYAEWYTSYLFPSLCTQKSVARITHILDTYKDLQPSITKILRIKRQMEERCTRIRSQE